MLRQILRPVRGRAADRSPARPDAEWGTVVALFGRYFVGRVDLLTRERFKTDLPMVGSPFTVTGDPDQAREHRDGLPTGGGDVYAREDLRARLADSAADYLVVDNSGALLKLCEVDGYLYTVERRDQTDSPDGLAGGDEPARPALFSPARLGLTDDLRSAYDEFIKACLETFDPSRIILVRSHVAPFWVDEEGHISPTSAEHRDARFLQELDSYFIEETGCLVSNAALGRFPTSSRWRSVESALRVAIEDDIVDLIGSGSRSAAHRGGDDAPPRMRKRSAAGQVSGAVAQGGEVNRKWLRAHFKRGGASYDDLLALAFLDQERPGRYDTLIRTCVQRAVADPTSLPLRETRRSFERSLRALRGWKWRGLRVPRGDLWRPQITIDCGDTVVRFDADGEITWVRSVPIAGSDVDAIVDGREMITPLHVRALLRSWPVYFERARRGMTAAPSVCVADSMALVDSCYWLDWAEVFTNESVAITSPGARERSQPPAAKTDLSFVFDPNTRIGTVGGGLMDQVTHIALFNDLCEPHGFDLYLDDFRYTWTRSHNGFEAARLAPALEAKRMTRLVSPALLERFRTEVTKSRLPWLFSQSRSWRDLGLREAFVVTRDYFNARRLVEIGPEFPFLVYMNDNELAGHIRNPPHPVTFFTTQHRIAIAAASAGPIAQVFSYHHLEEHGLPQEVAESVSMLKAVPHVAFHVRRGDYMNPHFDTDGWFSQQGHYIDAIEFLISTELGTRDFNVAVFSDDLDFVESHAAEYGLDRVTGTIRYIRGNKHYDSIFDSYMMSLCPTIVGSVGFFAATTSLLADPPSVFIRTRPDGVHVNWRREG